MATVRLLIGTLVLAIATADSGWAATYYTKKTGSDANSCATAQNSSTPKLTVASGVGCLNAGDTLIVGNGTYVETMTVSGKSATASNRITVQAENRRQAIIAPGGVSTRGLVVTSSYITVSGFVIDCTSSISDGSGACFSNNVTSNSGVWLLDNDFKDSQGSGIVQGGTSSFWRIEDNKVSRMGLAAAYSISNGIYLSSVKNSTILRNEVFENECNGIRLGNSGTNGGDTTDNEVAYNYIHNNGDGYGGVDDCGSDGAGIMVSGQRNVLHHNIIAHQYRSGIWFYNLNTTLPDDNNVAYNNTVYDVGHYCIRVASPHASTVVKNNHLTSCTLGTILDQGTGSVITSNRVTGVVTDCTVSTSDFTQKAGSLCINAGVNVGLPYNGSAPDIGAFETFTFASCEVPNSAADTIQITFTSNVHLLGSTLTTFTARRNGGANALTGAATKIGDTIVSLPLTDTYVGGDTVDWSWASGGFTDNARIGGTLNQPFLPVTNQSCTNNAGGAPTYVLSQVRYQFRGLIGAEDTTDIRGSDNIAAYEVQQGGAGRVRIVVTDATSNAPNTAFILRYSRNGGGYTIVPDVYGADGIAFCGSYYTNIGVANGQFTTAQISAVAGTHIPNGVILNSNAIPTINGLDVGYKTEGEYCFSFDTSASGTYTLQLWEQSGLAFTGTYLEPTITIVSPSSSAGLN